MIVLTDSCETGTAIAGVLGSAGGGGRFGCEEDRGV